LTFHSRTPGNGYSPLYNGQPFAYAVDWYRYAIYQNPSWNPFKLSYDDIAYADKVNPEGADTWKGDLSAFKQRGSKVIHYHGLIDPLISADNSARYYNHVRTTMNQTSQQLDSFYRFFRVSGLSHCAGGTGAAVIGQTGDYASLDAESNVLTAIVEWVEGGKAPDTILGSKYKNGSKASGIDSRKRHCRFPRRNVYKGKGDPKVPESWECVGTNE
jgi:feruloyl esterase